MCVFFFFSKNPLSSPQIPTKLSMKTISPQHTISLPPQHSLSQNVLHTFRHTVNKTQSLTGIFDVRKNSNRASNEPKVEACTYTPVAASLMWLKALFSSRATSSLENKDKYFNFGKFHFETLKTYLQISTSSGLWAISRLMPAIAFSKSLAAILTPWAATTSLCST